MAHLSLILFLPNYPGLFSIDHFLPFLVHFRFKIQPLMTCFSFYHFWYMLVSATSGTFFNQFLPFLAHFSFYHFWHVLDFTISGTSAISGSTTSAKLSWFIQHRSLSAISGTFQFLPLLAQFSFYHFWHILVSTISRTFSFLPVSFWHSLVSTISCTFLLFSFIVTRKGKQHGQLQN